MDLRSIINTEGSETSGPKQSTPITPLQTVPPPQIFREYSSQTQSPVNKHPSHDYGNAHTSLGNYQGGYQNRPAAPPPLQPPSQIDIRSPNASSHYSAQSPYTRHTPSSSVGGQYPFPQHPTPQSPAAPHNYPIPQQRESYPQSSAQPPHLPHHNSYGQPSPTPNTPPIGTPGGSYPSYQHQRSQSTQSTSTPTSAQSQHYFNQYPQDSPVSANSYPHAQLPQHQRQQSQPGTPLGPPVSNPRQTSGSHPLPTSPYQQRPQSAGTMNPPYSLAQRSPAQSISPHLEKLASIPIIKEVRRASAEQPQQPPPMPPVAREKSLSVSPKTQILNTPRISESTRDPQADVQHKVIENGQFQVTKRKFEDRESSEPQPTSQAGQEDAHGKQPSMSSPNPARKRRRYADPPIWAQSAIGRIKHNGALLTGKRHVNGKPSVDINISSSTGPKVVSNGSGQFSTVTRAPSQIAQPESKGDGPLGPWEPSINGIKPYEELSKLVADWLFVHVVSRPDSMELSSRGVEVEIEAKLGQLINKETNERFRLPVQTECLLMENRLITFKSSMTEAQHKTLNDFLNGKVAETHPDNMQTKIKPRVQIVYAHRRERDRFYELPPAAIANLPPAIQAQLNPRHAVKVRVTHDQKTGQQLAKIIKARVADLDVYMPRFPLDCRISVNLEMRYDGDIDSFVATSESSSRMPDRNKDRLSYTQSFYQIDLTQVTLADPNSKTEKEHELEIEISAAAVREQGQRAARGEPHRYAELIEGLMDNVRVLTRMVPDHNVVL